MQYVGTSDGHERFIGGVKAGKCKLKCAACKAEKEAGKETGREAGKMAVGPAAEGDPDETEVGANSIRLRCRRPSQNSLKLTKTNRPNSFNRRRTP